LLVIPLFAVTGADELQHFTTIGGVEKVNHFGNQNGNEPRCSRYGNTHEMVQLAGVNVC
jgi:hypothetical protein